MSMVRMILKEVGGRFENAAGAINSKDNMFAGSSGNAVSDKIGGGENNNPIAENKTEDTATETPEVNTESVEATETTEATPDTDTFSDENLKTYQKYQKESPVSTSTLKGKLKNLDLDPTKTNKPAVDKGGSSGGGAGMGKMAGMFQNSMGASGGAEGAGDMGADAGDMADAADAASDERLKNIFGDNEDAIKAFSKINAIKFTYNDKAKDIPGGKDKGIDDDVHYGVKAQEIAENPLTASAVSKDPISDYLQIDVKELTTANTAIISEICKRLLIIEKVLGIKVV